MAASNAVCLSNSFGLAIAEEVNVLD